MYKVFFNDSTIEIASEIKKSSNNNIVLQAESNSYDFVNQIICKIESDVEAADFLIINQEVNLVWELFRSSFIEIPAAGGFVRNQDGAFLFIRRFGFWDLPKGKIEKNETPEFAAIREVEEECGLTNLKIIRPLDSTYHIYRSPYHVEPENLVLKETKWFLMEYSGIETPVPQLDESIEDVRWFKSHELDLVMENTYSSLREFVWKTILVI
jgi:8-oxo-dGTP pyrophosphatase MutT (NUDIX family)